MKLMTDFTPIDKVLEEYFENTTPIPNNLKTAKRQFERGVLKWNSKIRIVEQFTGYKCTVLCFVPTDDSDLV